MTQKTPLGDDAGHETLHEKAIWSSHRGGPNVLGRFGCPSPRFHSHSLGRARSSLSRCMVGSVRAGAAFLLTAYLLRKWPGFHAQSPQPQAIGSFTPGLSILAFFSYEPVLLSLTPVLFLRRRTLRLAGRCKGDRRPRRRATADARRALLVSWPPPLPPSFWRSCRLCGRSSLRGA